MLAITDGFFSLAGIVCAWLAVWFITAQAHWSSVYLFVAVVALVVALFLYTLAQNAILWWLPQYAQQQLQASAEMGGSLVVAKKQHSYFLIFQYFEPSKDKLYINPLLANTNPMIGSRIELVSNSLPTPNSTMAMLPSTPASQPSCPMKS